MTQLQILLLAQKDVWKSLGNRFSEENATVSSGDIVSIVAACAGAAMLIWLLARLAKWQEEAAKKPNPQKLFSDLARLHKLTKHQQTLVQQLAEANSLPQPSIVFVRPDLFDAALRVDLPDSAAEQLEALRDRLFGKEEQDTPTNQIEATESSADTDPSADAVATEPVPLA